MVRACQAPPSRAEALELMSQHPNLIKHPILVHGAPIVLLVPARLEAGRAVCGGASINFWQNREVC